MLMHLCLYVPANLVLPRLPLNISDSHDVRECGSAWSRQGMLQHEGYILKPLSQTIGDTRGLVEVGFYERNACVCREGAGGDGTLGLEQRLAPFLSQYGGQCIHGDIKYMKLVNVCAGFSHPCQMDIKLGSTACDKHASAEKRRADSTRWALQRRYGFRLCGMEVYDRTADQYRLHDREVVRSIVEAEVVPLFGTFLAAAGSRQRVLAAAFMSKLRDLLSWFEEQTCYSFLSSSVLLAFDSDMSSEGGDTELLPVVKLIDFGHVSCDVGSKDENVAMGLRSLVHIFKQLAEMPSSAPTP